MLSLILKGERSLFWPPVPYKVCISCISACNNFFPFSKQPSPNRKDRNSARRDASTFKIEVSVQRSLDRVIKLTSCYFRNRPIPFTTSDSTRPLWPRLTSTRCRCPAWSPKTEPTKARAEAAECLKYQLNFVLRGFMILWISDNKGMSHFLPKICSYLSPRVHLIMISLSS